MNVLLKLFRSSKKSNPDNSFVKQTKPNNQAPRLAWLMAMLAWFLVSPAWAIDPTGLSITINDSANCSVTPGNVTYSSTLTYSTDDGGGVDHAAVVLVDTNTGNIIAVNRYQVTSGAGTLDITDDVIETTEITDVSILLIDTINTTEYGIGDAAPLAMSPNIIFEQPIGFLCATPDTTRPDVTIAAPATATAAYTATFTFTEVVTGFVVGDITVGNGTASAFSGSGDTYTATITPDTGATSVTIDVAADVAIDGASNGNTAAAQAVTSITTTSTTSVIPDFNIREQSKRARRAMSLVNLRTIQSQDMELFKQAFRRDIASTHNINVNDIKIERTPSSSFDGESNGFGLNGDKQLNRGKFAFNLRDYVNTLARADADKNGKANVSAAAGDIGPAVNNAYQSDYNLWVKASWLKSEEDRGDTNDHGDFTFLAVGADYRYSRDTVIGVIVQLDESDQKSKRLDIEGESDGWMIGPYVVTKLTDKLIFDARTSWGKSSNKINPLGTYWDKYDSERFLVSANLTGDMQYGNWQINPSAGVFYIKEELEAYTDSNGIRIDSQDVKLGTLTFGPSFTYNYKSNDGLLIRPSIGLKGVYDFDAPDITDVNGLAVGTEELRAELKLGVDIMTRSGTTFTASYKHDGIGESGFEIRSAEVGFIMPLELDGSKEGASFQGSYSFGGAASLLETADEGNLSFKLTVPF